MNRRVTNTESFVEKALKIHKDFYDYSNVSYKNSKTKVQILCPIHGNFEQTPDSHLRGAGCPSCSGNKKLTLETFIEKSNQVHNNKYDYSCSKYINSQTPIEIICPIHGKFLQKPNNHLIGWGCNRCGRELSGNKQRLSEEDLIKKIKEVHGDSYSYDFSNYKNYQSFIDITCPIHGIFQQSLGNHLKGQNCPQCSFNSKQSKIEKDLESIFETSIISSYRPSFLEGKELDLYIPSLNLAIEYNGFVYHHSSRDISKFLDSTYKEPYYHLDKYEKCKNNGIDLIHIYEFEDINKWKRKLQLYINNSEKYEVKFINQKRTETLKNLSLEFYGKSEIKKL